LGFSASLVSPRNPRNPQQQSGIGEAKDESGKRKYMRIKAAVRSLLFLLVLLVVMSAASFAQVGISITIGPPAIPVYEQPVCPGDGYIWTPGYWAYDSDIGDYYWVPGTWVLAPEVGFLWTPGWWGWGDGGFLWHAGYWGPHIGFYGGIDYGFGYFGVGFEGGRWDGGHFFYNREVTNVNVTVIHNVYSKTVVNNTTVNRVSYNGGNGGITARPTPEEEAAEHDRHVAPLAAQTQHEQSARSDPQQRASVNHGKPMVAATPKPGDLHDRAAVPAKEAGAPYRAPAGREGTEERGNQQAGHAENKNVPHPENAVHPNDLPARERPTASSTGNANLDKKYQQQQEKLNSQQDKERQKLQQQQDKEHQQMARQKADEAKNQQLEQKHQQQTQQLAQRHAQQQQQLQQEQQSAKRPPK
jgi:hypothetical protein